MKKVHFPHSDPSVWRGLDFPGPSVWRDLNFRWLLWSPCRGHPDPSVWRGLNFSDPSVWRGLANLKRHWTSSAHRAEHPIRRRPESAHGRVMLSDHQLHRDTGVDTPRLLHPAGSASPVWPRSTVHCTARSPGTSSVPGWQGPSGIDPGAGCNPASPAVEATVRHSSGLSGRIEPSGYWKGRRSASHRLRDMPVPSAPTHQWGRLHVHER